MLIERWLLASLPAPATEWSSRASLLKSPPQAVALDLYLHSELHPLSHCAALRPCHRPNSGDLWDSGADNLPTDPPWHWS